MRNYKFFLWLTISIVAVGCLIVSGHGRAQNIAAPVVKPVPVRVVVPNPVPVVVPEPVIEDRDNDSEMPLKEEENIQKTLPLTPSEGRRLLDVDNIFGSIDVVGTQSDQVQLVAHKTIRAESKQDIEKAKKEVTLDITQEAGLLRLYVNGPFRCNCNDGCGRRGDDGYQVKYDFQLQVPRELELKLKTVNSGHITVKDVTGRYSVRNVNGKIEMQDVAGSGQAKTVNGAVKVTFRENPKENSDFSTINGNVELSFVRNLAADFRFKTMNGNIYTDFPMTSLPQQASAGERRNGKFVFHADRYTGGRVGSGGPEIKAENLNGSIRILERQ